jgi:LPPG:FO 2-phospho-L-lactate transferase
MIVALSGGVGGAKLALGLDRVLPPGDLTVVVNTADDFEHLGLSISPDIDTLMYTLADLNNPVTGWGRRDETWSFMTALKALGGPDWFQLGDSDLATHVERTRRLRAGVPLSCVTDEMSRALGIRSRILPMTNDHVRTQVETSEGWLDFQDYFVRLRCEPRISAIRFVGATEARPHPDLILALRAPQLRAVVICPSNPFLSVDPILALPGVRDALKQCAAPVIAISPIIGNLAVKGPTAKIMDELGMPSSAAAVANYYNSHPGGPLLNAFVIDDSEAAFVISGLRVEARPTLMLSLKHRTTLAAEVLALADAMTRKE